ncbi:MAG: hypothetical protein IT447_15725 [Phycisphaerales bacterium]|jgi:hypothetical protein|nr:hypothetical protein [Phycisphaerales bacterium]
MNILAITFLLAEGGWIPLVVIGLIWFITAAAATAKKTKKNPKALPPKKRPAIKPKTRSINVLPPPLPVETNVEPENNAPSAPTADPVVRRSKPQAVSAEAIHNWLTPNTLRQQFIITELFQEPIALRGEDRSR